MMAAAISMMVAVSATSCKAADKETDTNMAADAALAVDAVSEAEAQSGVVMPEAEAPVAIDTTGYTTTASGLKYKVLREGTGAKPSGPASMVKVHYEGKHLDGTVFDSSYQRGEPIDFPLNRVILGWTEGVMLMNEGAKYEFIIPSDLAYGKMGTPGGPIKPNEDLYFVVELLQAR